MFQVVSYIFSISTIDSAFYLSSLGLQDLVNLTLGVETESGAQGKSKMDVKKSLRATAAATGARPRRTTRKVAEKTESDEEEEEQESDENFDE